ncbi:MAG: CusA/CzcA family heavy metal efflux RND transporter [Bacteroidales bacterium]|nr:CusA/CzcA family heavy metal efflux RND transporter [Bacteroidales bacterium]
MVEKIISFSLNNRLIIGLLTFALIVWGVYNFTILPIDAVPDITNNQVQVITTSPSLAPQEVEQFITFPVEIAMANIQDVKEIRSISRSGLSVVTIVFKDKVNPYLARQLVSEQIKIAESDIPDGYGSPEMMPITTGLGEIYQYVIEPKPGYENVYDEIEIRTVQDWIVKRYLSGIPGIVEISSFGGKLKQYEVSITPKTLVEMDITILEVFNALEKNNQNTGGSYIERGPEAFYIRADGLIKDKDDIGDIVVKNIGNIPILIRDVATVKISSPPRFGAMTKDGKGEAVGGITLMLKGGNTSQVIQRVKARVAELQELLPAGLEIHPYLDRSKLISKTTRTVSKNLIEGGLIVIFVLVILLGNFRAGLIVASVIPLSMLFAFSMMNLFGVSANLMSLGAIDFGLIVDGSVIIVEGIIYQMHKVKQNTLLTQAGLNDKILLAGKRVSRSAVFGVLIILIVYIPILAFTGIEGKMFKPMAQTVSFALLGALLLSLTYVPVVSSIFLSKKVKNKVTFSDKLVTFLEKAHYPVLFFSLKNRKLLLGLTVIVLIASFYLFSKMGGEFIPTLEEGDLAAQMTLSPGSSLSESIASSTKAEKILLDAFPEVLEVVSKIGTAEVPTDPMAIEDADIMIILKKKDEWTSAKTREELVDLMKEKLSVLPGLTFEFQQPIQLRFNELMTGVKSDVAVKIYGEELEVLYERANKAAAIISKIEGAGDVKVEQIVGLPQLVINYKRDEIAKYGLNISDINRIIKMAYAGESTGVIFEGEKRFDLVVRLCEECRSEFKSIENLRINPPTGELILLSQVADISFVQGPMQISRDNTKRRITIGINVRNRDIESFVNEVNDQLTADLSLPAGYYLTYGGQFENLKAAQKTSSVAVPIALITILVLLYFAFYSLKQSVMIFSAIPLAAVGGIWALYLRGMPFSISAGVGFIALFGVAVLNGIVLISYYNQLKKEGMTDVVERVLVGTRSRLRPVIMTASVAALGFFPMALSTAAGAEVQKPLATVVIGGLVTATFLTLVVLPVIYVVFNRSENNGRMKKVIPLLLLLVFPFSGIFAQEEKLVLSVDKAIEIALEKNPEIKKAALQFDASNRMKKSGFELNPLEFDYQDGQINSQLRDRSWSISQPFRFPNYYSARSRYLRSYASLQSKKLRVVTNDIVKDVKLSYNDWNRLEQEKIILREKDSLFSKLVEASLLRYKAGEIDQLAYFITQTELSKIHQAYIECKLETETKRNDLSQLLNLNAEILPEPRIVVYQAPEYFKDSLSPYSNSMMEYYQQLSEVKDKEIRQQQSQNYPDMYVGYFSQSIDQSKGFEGFQLGATLPLWFWSNSAKTKSLKIEKEINEYSVEILTEYLRREIDLQRKAYNSLKETIAYYEQGALEQAELVINNAQISFGSGDIGYHEYARSLAIAYEIKMDYLAAISRYNQTIVELEYLLAK